MISHTWILPHTTHPRTVETRIQTCNICTHRDDFGIKVVGDEHAQHIINTLQKYYTITVDPKGELFCGIKLKWDYDKPKPTVELSMPDYINKALINSSMPCQRNHSIRRTNTHPSPTAMHHNFPSRMIHPPYHQIKSNAYRI